MIGNTTTLKRLTHQLAITKANNQFIRIHVLPSEVNDSNPEENHYKVIFTWRDPRDQAISLLCFILDKSKKFSYGPLFLQSEFGKLSFNNQLLEIITGEGMDVRPQKK